MKPLGNLPPSLPTGGRIGHSDFVFGSDEKLYMCLFCGDAIEPTETDPCSGVFTAAWSEDDFEKETAQYWFHARCLRMRAHPRVPLYFLDLADDA